MVLMPALVQSPSLEQQHCSACRLDGHRQGFRTWRVETASILSILMFTTYQCSPLHNLAIVRFSRWARSHSVNTLYVPVKKSHHRNCKALDRTTKASAIQNCSMRCPFGAFLANHMLSVQPNNGCQVGVTRGSTVNGTQRKSQ